jgi:hypothetical protein
MRGLGDWGCDLDRTMLTRKIRFVYLGNCFNYTSPILSLLTKVVVNQLAFTPLFNTYFFGMQSLLSHPPSL